MRPLALLFAFALAAAAPARAQTSFILESTSFGADASLAPQYGWNQGGCGGDNTSPELHWTGAPPAARASP